MQYLGRLVWAEWQCFGDLEIHTQCRQKPIGGLFILLETILPILFGGERRRLWCHSERMGYYSDIIVLCWRHQLKGNKISRTKQWSYTLPWVELYTSIPTQALTKTGSRRAFVEPFNVWSWEMKVIEDKAWSRNSTLTVSDTGKGIFLFLLKFFSSQSIQQPPSILQLHRLRDQILFAPRNGPFSRWAVRKLGLGRNKNFQVKGVTIIEKNRIAMFSSNVDPLTPFIHLKHKLSILWPLWFMACQKGSYSATSKAPKWREPSRGSSICTSPKETRSPARCLLLMVGVRSKPFIRWAGEFQNPMAWQCLALSPKIIASRIPYHHDLALMLSLSSPIGLLLP